jgi:hypothetical protein
MMRPAAMERTRRNTIAISGVGINGIQSLNGSVTITNSGTISGIQGIQLGGDGTITNNPTGSITGLAGVAILASAGQTTLSNSGTLNGNVTLSSSLNTVQLFTGSRINGNLDLGSNAGSTLIFDGGGTQTFSQAVTGTVNNGGSLTKQGSGTWIIDTILNAPVSTKLLDGILEVNGSLRSSNVTVQPGATLKGVGNVVGNIFNFGTLSPGNSPGTLTVNGNFSQGPNGVLNVQIVSLQNYSRLAVTGHANLDGTLSLTLASGFRPPPGSKFAVLTAGQGISGKFRSISTNAPVKVTYESGLVDVVSASQPKPEIHLSDGTPVSTTALLADYTFYGFGSLAERAAQGWWRPVARRKIMRSALRSTQGNSMCRAITARPIPFQSPDSSRLTIGFASTMKFLCNTSRWPGPAFFKRV